MMALSGSVWMLLASWEQISGSQAFRIRNVEIRGIQSLKENHFDSYLAGVRNRSLFEADLDGLRRRLESDPWIRSALVKRVLPDKLVILVREKNPVGFVKDGDAVLLIDEEGAFIAPVSTPDAGIPEFRGIHVARLTRGDETERGRVRNGILFLRVFQQPNFLAGKQSLTAITLKSDDDIEAVIGGSLYLFRYPFPAQQWLRFLSVRSDILARHPAIEEIDLRYEGKVIVRPSREKA